MEWFVNPGMAAFAAFGSIPVIIHLLNRQKYKQVPWAAMEFLLRAIKRTHSRLRLENLLLLLARILVMVLLALALAQPLLEQSPLAVFDKSDTHLILVIDHSYSMGQKISGAASVPMETAKNTAAHLLKNLNASRGDKVSLILMSDHPEAVIAEPSMQIEFATNKVADLQVSDYGTNAVKTLELVLPAARLSTNARKEVVVLSDFQRHAWTGEDAEKDSFRTLLGELGQIGGLNVRLIDVGLPDPSNCGVEKIESSEPVVAVGRSVSYTALVRNWGHEESLGRTLEWFVDGNRVEGDVGVIVPAGDAAAYTLQHTFTEPGPHYIQAQLNSDPIAADNKATFALDAKPFVKVLIVNGEPSPDSFQDEAICLRLALNPSVVEEEPYYIYDVETVRDIVFAETEVRGAYDLVVIANLEMLFADKVTQLETYVKNGGGLLIWVGDRINRVGWNEQVYKDGQGLLPAELGEVVEEKDGVVYRLEKIKFEHPALEKFRGFQSKLTDLMIASFYKTKVDAKRTEETLGESSDIRVLARYDDPDSSPFLIEKKLVHGKVILVTTSADIEWNDMIKEAGYLILVDQLAKYLVAQDQGGKNVRVGAALEYFLRVDQYSRSFTLETPDRSKTTLSPTQPGETGAKLVYDQTGTAGAYALERVADETAAPTEQRVLSYFAVNVDPLEGNLERIGEDDLRQRFPDFKFTWQSQAGGGEEGGPAAKPPRTSRAWRWLAYGVLALLLAEMFMAQRFGARR